MRIEGCQHIHLAAVLEQAPQPESGIRDDHLLLAVQKFSHWGEVMHIGGSAFHRKDEAALILHADMDFHPEIPLIAFLGLMHLLIPLLLLVLVPPAHSCFALLKVELGAAIKVASMIVPCFMTMPLALRWAFTTAKIRRPRSCFSSRYRNVRIVVSSGIRSLMMSIPEKRCIVGTSISASSIAGSLRSYYCCRR